MTSEPNDTSLDELLRQAFVRLRHGPCPTDERLQEFVSGRLPEEEAESVSRHIAGCGYCELVVTKLREWPAVERRFRRRFGGARWPRIFVPAVAWLLVLAMAYPAYLGLRRRESPEAAPSSIEGADTLRLDPATRGGGADGRGLVSSGARVFVLSFFVPIREGRGYSAAIVDASGRTVAAQSELRSHDALGNFALVCRRAQFPPGRYVLTVTEEGKESRRFEFPFTL